MDVHKSWLKKQKKKEGERAKKESKSFSTFSGKGSGTLFTLAWAIFVGMMYVLWYCLAYLSSVSPSAYSPTVPPKIHVMASLFEAGTR